MLDRFVFGSVSRISANHQQVCRTDREDRSPLSPAAERDAVRKFRGRVPSADAVVVSDYARGMLMPEELTAALRAMQPTARVFRSSPRRPA